MKDSSNDTENSPGAASASGPMHIGVPVDVIIVRYGELALKSTGVRNWYEKILVKNIAAMLNYRGIEYSQIRREWGRIFSRSGEGLNHPMISTVSIVLALINVVSAEDITAPSRAARTSPPRSGEKTSFITVGNACSGATWYYLWVDDSTGNRIRQWYEASAVDSGGICSVTPTTTLNQGKCRWWIRGWNSTTWGEWSDQMSFEVE